MAIKLNPKYKNAYIYRGSAYYSKSDYDQAISDYTEAIKLPPKHYGAYETRGNG